MLEVFADVLCPFTHVGLRRLVERRRELGARGFLRVRAWPLELVNGEPLAADLVGEEVEELRAQVAPELFAGFDRASFPTTSLPAMTLAARAYGRSPELGERVSMALRDALFEEGRDIGSAEVLADLAGAHDLEAQPVDRSLIVADWEEGRRRGVQGSPHFFVDGEGFFCPTLDIERIAGRLAITVAPARFAAFMARAFPAGPS